jgi:hypothetical protein
MFPVHTSEDKKSGPSADDLVALGVLGKWVPLNGGSDTRAGTRDHYREYAIGLGLEFIATGHDVKVGGLCNRKRGQWFMAYGARKLHWEHWRKAKRDIRKHAAECLRKGRMAQISGLVAASMLVALASQSQERGAQQ